MNFHHKAWRGLVGGKSGMGKTTKLIKLYEEQKATWRFIYDPGREFAHKLKLPSCAKPEQMAARVKQRLPVAFDPKDMFGEGPVAVRNGFEFFCTWVYDVSCKLDGVKLLLCDEIQKPVNVRKACPQSVIIVMDEGRRQEINTLFGVNKGLSKLHEEIRAQLTDLYIFHISDRRSLEWLEDDFTDEEIAAIKDSFGVGKFIHKEV